MNNNQRLDEIRARERAATPGPWGVTRKLAKMAEPEIIGPVHHAPQIGVPFAKFIFHEGYEAPQRDAVANAFFTANARKDIPWLLDQIETYQATVVELNELRKQEFQRAEKAEFENKQLQSAIGEPMMKQLRPHIRRAASLEMKDK